MIKPRLIRKKYPWIEVSDKDPVDSEVVMVTYDYKREFTGMRYMFDGREFWCHETEKIATPLAWRTVS